MSTMSLFAEVGTVVKPTTNGFALVFQSKPTSPPMYATLRVDGQLFCGYGPCEYQALASAALNARLWLFGEGKG